MAMGIETKSRKEQIELYKAFVRIDTSWRMQHVDVDGKVRTTATCVDCGTYIEGTLRDKRTMPDEPLLTALLSYPHTKADCKRVQEGQGFRRWELRGEHVVEVTPDKNLI